MKIRVGLKSNLTDLFHHSASLKSAGNLTLIANSQSININTQNKIFFLAENNGIKVEIPNSNFEKTFFNPVLVKNNHSSIDLNVQVNASKAATLSNLPGEIEISNINGQLLAVLIVDLEVYVQYVLSTEIPGSYAAEAKKAQAVIARTYALHPRVDHSAENFLVCNSYLCCQAFDTARQINSWAKQITNETDGLILTHENKPILAMFSANAGGHTENFENAFSDYKTNVFPAKPLPYLKGVAEGHLPNKFPSEAVLKELFYSKNPQTKDAWSPSFRWQLKLSANALESHMHHTIATLKSDKQFAPFIKGPESKTFGHIEKFEITQRGISGLAMYMNIHTSHGVWKISKELPIRQVFANPDLHLKRLRSARMVIEHIYDALGLLKEISILGLGTGHGVGMQQDGAQGFAKAGFNYKQILAHYYSQTVLSKI